MSGFVWYSFGSDKTGPALAKALGFDAGRKTPNFDEYETVVGWGCKPGTKYNPLTLAAKIRAGKVRTLNHPDKVQANRNKLATLERLSKAGIPVPGFVPFDPRRPEGAAGGVIAQAVEDGKVAYPLLALNRANKREPVLCHTLDELLRTLKQECRGENPFNYVRSYDYADEFRVHVFRDSILFGQKKELVMDPIDAATGHLIKRFRSSRKKEGKEITPAEAVVLAEVLPPLVVNILQGGNQPLKSASSGWRFATCPTLEIPGAVLSCAIDALDSVGLDMGAVSISHTKDTHRVLGITTAPALNGQRLDAYAGEIAAFAGGEATQAQPKKKAAAKRDKRAPVELVSRLIHRVRNLSAEEAQSVLASLE